MVDDAKPALAPDFVDRLDAHVTAGRLAPALATVLGSTDAVPVAA